MKKIGYGPKPLTKNQAALELILAGVIWGFGFVAGVWALQAFTPTESLVYRFVIAVLLGELLYLFIQGPKFTSVKTEFLRAFPAGALLGTMLLLQAIGLKFTTATKSGFITSLYVILVPLMNTWFFKAPATWKNYLMAAIALGGTLILMDASLHGWNIGDLWTLACSVFAALHIIYIGSVANKIGNAFRFNNFQSFWCLVTLAPLLLFQEKITISSPNWLPWIGIIALGAASSVVAFYLQVRSQKVLSDSTASMLFLLESPFAAMFGFLLLNERLSPFQMLGALIILGSAILQILLDPATKNQKPHSSAE